MRAETKGIALGMIENAWLGAAIEAGRRRDDQSG